MKSVDISDFQKDEKNLNALYGLPTDVKFCKKCVISNQRPNSSVEFKHKRSSIKKTINFDENGICDACKLAEQKKIIDWDERERALKELCDQYRGDGSRYDCLVPGSGGKDSFYAAHVLKYKYGMNPLTVTWAPHLYTNWGWQNFNSWVHAGFDNYLMTPNGKSHRLLTRLAVDNLLHPFQPFILGQKNLAPKMAELFNIPLVFYGENESEYGNPIQDASTSERDFSYFSNENMDEVYLGGTSFDELINRYKLTKSDLDIYLPINPEKLKRKDVKVHYLGYYLKWHPQSCYYYAKEHSDFIASPERTSGTYSKYNSIDDKIDDFHYHTTLMKFGIGRATYDASQEIRSGDITREEGVALVKKFDQEYPKRFEKDVFEYLSIDEKHFSDIVHEFEQPTFDKDYYSSLCDTFRSPHLWYFENNEWKLRHTVYNES